MTELRAIAGGLADVPDPLRIPPHDAHAETALVVTMVLEPSRISEILALGVRVEHFYGSARTRRVFEAVAAMHEAAEKVDVVSVATRLRETGRLAEIGGMAGLTELLGEAMAVNNVAAYVRAVRDAWRLRQLLFECQRLIPTIYGTRGSAAEVERGQAYSPAQDLLEKVSARVHELACETSTLTAQSGLEVMATAHAQMQAQADRAARAPGSISGTRPACAGSTTRSAVCIRASSPSSEDLQERASRRCCSRWRSPSQPKASGSPSTRWSCQPTY
jgi:replicative DNA helicase